MQHISSSPNKLDTAYQIKKNAQKKADIMWKFSTQIAEKLFLFGEKNALYAQKIFFYELNNSFDQLLTLIEADFNENNIDYYPQEIQKIYDDIEKNYKGNSEKCFYM